MTRSLVRTLLGSLAVSASAAAILLGAATPALAQDQPPATSVPPPMRAMAAPKGLEDMTGSIGFGVGVAAGAQTLIAPDSTVALKYWLSDVLAVSPALRFTIFKPAPAGLATDWNFSPSAIVLFVPFRSTATRLEVGGGLGISLSKDRTTGPNTQVRIFLPIHAGVEHFFTRWFSMGIAFQSNLFDYQKDNGFGINIVSTQLAGQLFFYTD